MSEKRPLGVALLGVCNALLSASLLAGGILGLIRVYGVWKELKQIDEYVLVLLSLDIAMFVLAFVCGAAGLDLWRLRSRGRSATILVMSILGFLGANIFAITQTDHSVMEDPRPGRIGGAVSVGCIAAIIYLLLPSVRQRFKPTSASGTDPLCRR